MYYIHIRKGIELMEGLTNVITRHKCRIQLYTKPIENSFFDSSTIRLIKIDVTSDIRESSLRATCHHTVCVGRSSRTDLANPIIVKSNDKEQYMFDAQVNKYVTHHCSTISDSDEQNPHTSKVNTPGILCSCFF